MGGLADQQTFWFKFWSVIESGGWVIFTYGNCLCSWLTIISC